MGQMTTRAGAAGEQQIPDPVHMNKPGEHVYPFQRKDVPVTCLLEEETRRAETGLTPMLPACEPSLFYYLSKRLLDITLAFVGLLLLIPLFLLIALCIKLDDGGNVLYFREVLGRQGKRFLALKFRTMIPDADAYLEQHPELLHEYQQNMKLMHDPRITRVGKWLRRASLDELPQLLNVLVGQMSLVGPRIIHPSELPRYGAYAQPRLSVKPGITGLWQISGRQHISYDERVLLDMRYLATRSYITDLLILLKTFKVLFVHTGA